MGTGDVLRLNATAWVQVLARDRTSVVTRRRSDRWSDLEYAAHVRDVFRLYLERLTMMLTEENPVYPDWDQDATAVAENYGAHDPTVVSAELRSAASALAEAFDSMEDEQWSRLGRRSDGADFTVDSFARYLVHDPLHHLWDVSGAAVASP